MMKKLLLCAALLLSAVTGLWAAPIPASSTQGAAQWEYCEVYCKGGGFVGSRPRMPAGGPLPAAVPQGTTRLVTAETEIEATNWEDLATKIKAVETKSTEGKPSHKLRVFNKLGADGWEIVECHHETGSGCDVWTFRRKSNEKKN
jgi:hypothetical protein